MLRSVSLYPHPLPALILSPPEPCYKQFLEALTCPDLLGETPVTALSAFLEIQSKRQERKRRSTANPAYSGFLETEVGLLGTTAGAGRNSVEPHEPLPLLQ